MNICISILKCNIQAEKACLHKKQVIMLQNTKNLFSISGLVPVQQGNLECSGFFITGSFYGQN